MHEFVLSRSCIVLANPLSILNYIYPYVDSPEFDAETDEETMTTNDHSGIPDTLVVSSKNCLASLLIRSDNIRFLEQSALPLFAAARAWWVGKWWLYAPYIVARKPTQPESVDYAYMVVCMVTVLLE